MVKLMFIRSIMITFTFQELILYCFKLKIDGSLMSLRMNFSVSLKVIRMVFSLINLVMQNFENFIMLTFSKIILTSQHKESNLELANQLKLHIIKTQSIFPVLQKYPFQKELMLINQ